MEKEEKVKKKEKEDKEEIEEKEENEENDEDEEKGYIRGIIKILENKEKDKNEKIEKFHENKEGKNIQYNNSVNQNIIFIKSKKFKYCLLAIFLKAFFILFLENFLLLLLFLSKITSLLSLILLFSLL